MIHLTETGFHAGRRFCMSNRSDGAQSVHGMYAPLDNPEFRAKCCPDCLKVWALEAYDDGDDMPQWVSDIRALSVP